MSFYIEVEFSVLRQLLIDSITGNRYSNNSKMTTKGEEGDIAQPRSFYDEEIWKRSP